MKRRSIKPIGALAVVGVVSLIASALVSASVRPTTSTPQTSAGASADCKGNWPATLRVKPARLARSVAPGYYVWYDSSGWHLRTATPSTQKPRSFTGRIVASGALRLRAVHRDDPADSVSAAGKSLSFRFKTQSRADGLDFTAGCARSLTFVLNAGGKAWPARSIYLGARGDAPANRFKIERPAESGLEGQVLISPTCPVQRAGESCTEPSQASVRIERFAKKPTGKGDDSRTTLVTTVQTDAQGRFRVELPAGFYRLVAEQSGPQGLPGKPKPTDVEVEGGIVTEVTVLIDSGIRAAQP